MRLSRLFQKKGNVSVIKVKLCSVKELGICNTAVFLVCFYTEFLLDTKKDKKQSSRHSPSESQNTMLKSPHLTRALPLQTTLLATPFPHPRAAPPITQALEWLSQL